MPEKGEKEPLLAINTDSSNSNKDQQISEKATFSWPQYFCLNVIVFLFAAAMVLDSNIIPLFIYGYFKNEQNSTNDVISNFSKFDGGGSKHVKCGMNTTTKIEDIAQSLSSTWLWYFKMTEYGCQAICLICAGLFTDIIGRKPIIFLALFGASVRFFLKGFIIYQKYDIRFFFITYAIAGLSGSNAAFATAVFALIADSTPSGQSRTIYLAIYDLVLGIGDGVVQLATGYLIQDTGYVIPCALSSGLCLFCACLSIASLPESVKKKNSFSAKESINRLVGFYHSNKYMKHGYPTWKFNLTMLIYVVFAFPMSASVNTLFEQGSPFCWTPKQIGLFSCVSMMALLVVGVALMRLLQYCITDETIGLLGCLSSVAEKMVFFLATSSWMLYIAPAVGILHVMPLPVLRGLLSRMVQKEEHGAVFANMAILQVAISIGSVTTFNNIYSETVEWNRGFVFLVMAGFYLLSAIIFVPITYSKIQPKLKEETIVNQS